MISCNDILSVSTVGCGVNVASQLFQWHISTTPGGTFPLGGQRQLTDLPHKFSVKWLQKHLDVGCLWKASCFTLRSMLTNKSEYATRKKASRWSHKYITSLTYWFFIFFTVFANDKYMWKCDPWWHSVLMPSQSVFRCKTIDALYPMCSDIHFVMLMLYKLAMQLLMRFQKQYIGK